MPVPSRFSHRLGQMQYLAPVLAMGLALTTTACSKGAPSGQTVATVNGEAITQSELNFELGLSGAPVADWNRVKPEVLQSLINRKLIVQAAERDGIDKQPEVVLAGERARELVVAERAMQTTTAALRQSPSGRDVEAYLDAHPQVGSNRQILSVEQVRFPVPTDAAVTNALAPAKTMAELIQVLEARGITFQRGATEIDTVTIDDKTRRQLTTSASGEPVIVFDGAAAIANHVTGARPLATSPSMAAALAKQQLATEQLQSGISQRQAVLRKAAKIDYAKGFAPRVSPTPNP